MAARKAPCPVCGVLVPVKHTRKGKPYWHCNECLVQVFIRGKVGMSRFRRLKGSRPGHSASEEVRSR